MKAGSGDFHWGLRWMLEWVSMLLEHATWLVKDSPMPQTGLLLDKGNLSQSLILAADRAMVVWIGRARGACAEPVISWYRIWPEFVWFAILSNWNYKLVWWETKSHLRGFSYAMMPYQRMMLQDGRCYVWYYADWLTTIYKTASKLLLYTPITRNTNILNSNVSINSHYIHVNYSFGEEKKDIRKRH